MRRLVEGRMNRHLLALLLAGAAWASSAAPAPDSLVEVRVEPSDTLSELSRDLMLDSASWREVARLNKLANPNRIYPGQVLLVPERLLRSLPVSVKVVAAHGDLRADDQPVAAGTQVNEGQRLATGDQTSAVVQLGDGSRVKLGPSTLAEIVANREYAQRSTAAPGSDGPFGGMLRLIQGSIEVFATKVLRAKPLEVTTPTAVVGVRGTEFRVGAEPSVSHAEVIEGIVQATAARDGTSVPLPAGFGVSIDAQTRLPLVRALPSAPDLSGVPERFERPLVRFKLPDAAQQSHRVQVASDPTFDHIVYDAPVAPGAEVRIAGLDDAQWHLRARTLTPEGLGGLDAKRVFELKARPEPPALSAPRPNAKQAAGDVQMAWARNPEAQTYRLQVAPSGSGFTQPTLQRDQLGGTDVTLPALPPGRYDWRMSGVRASGDAGPWGDPQTFELRPLPEPPTGGLADDGKQIALAWSSRPEDRQQVELARDPGFTQLVASAELAGSAWVVPRPEAPGTYYFRYRSVEPDGFTTPWSGTLQIEVPRDWRGLWPLLLPLLLAL